MKTPVNNYVHFIVTFFILASSATIAFMVPQIVDMISSVGGFGMTFIAVTIPGICYYKLKGRLNSVVLVFTIILTLVGIFGATLSLLDTLGIIDLDNM